MKANSTVKWRAIAAELERRIAAGEITEKFPSEPQLARAFGTARGTVRLAVEELKRRGLLESRRGAGTFVTERKGSGRIGVIIPDYGNGQFFNDLLSGFNAAIREDGYVMLFSDAPKGTPSKRVKAVKLAVRDFIGQRVDGVIFRPFVSDKMARANREVIRTFRQAGVPVVLVDSDVADSDGARFCDFVGVDNVNEGRRIGEYLLRAGRRRIAFLHSDTLFSSSKNYSDRKAGLQLAVTAAGLEWTKGNMIDSRPDDLKDLERVFLGGRAPDAVVCGNDEEALVLLKSLGSLRLKVPQEVAVVGFDDIVAAQLANPPLTTVHQPVEMIAAKAFQVLKDRIGGKSGICESITLPARLVRRTSSERVG